MMANRLPLFKEDEYQARYYCTNCGRYFQATFKRGNYAPSRHVRCPVCETDTGEKALNRCPDA